MSDHIDDPRAEEPLLANEYEDDFTNTPDLDLDAAPLAETDSLKSHSDTDAEGGVQQADAVTLVWTRLALVLAYAYFSTSALLQWNSRPLKTSFLRRQ